MPSRWFKIPKTGTGNNNAPIRPDISGYRWAAIESPGNAPLFLCKVYGTESELDTLTSQPGVTELPNVPAQALNAMTGLERSQREWESVW